MFYCHYFSIWIKLIDGLIEQLVYNLCGVWFLLFVSDHCHEGFVIIWTFGYQTLLALDSMIFWMKGFIKKEREWRKEIAHQLIIKALSSISIPATSINHVITPLFCKQRKQLYPPKEGRNLWLKTLAALHSIHKHNCLVNNDNSPKIITLLLVLLD